MLSHATDTQEALDARLNHFLTRPQRHRLLHGYPLAGAIPFVDQETVERFREGDEEFSLLPDSNRALLVGVLPHPFCNPQLAGCGFCTFPHEKFHRERATHVVDGVITEILADLHRHPELAGRSVSGLYFGGGTANLTPVESFRRLAGTLEQSFDLRDAEVSLEGIPIHFDQNRSALLDVMRETMTARHFRISMGIQTFDDTRLASMGRKAFGDASTFAAAVDSAHRRGMTASADLLFNLPGQSLDEMKSDVAHAVEIGLDQVCLYHLVMFRGLGTPWSRDDALLEQLPSNEVACENWLALREELISAGFRQTTLTNFERQSLCDDPRGYRYELMSFEPERCQMRGFGPSGISVVSREGRDLKVMNPESSAQYLQTVAGDGPTWNRIYRYDGIDQRILYLTRHLAALSIDGDRYDTLFGRTLEDDFGDELNVLREFQLIERDLRLLKLTPKGMFFSDSVVGIMADKHLQRRRNRRADANSNSNGHM